MLSQRTRPLPPRLRVLPATLPATALDLVGDAITLPSIRGERTQLYTTAPTATKQISRRRPGSNVCNILLQRHVLPFNSFFVPAHVDSKHKLVRHRCSFSGCGKVFKHLPSLTRHLNDKHRSSGAASGSQPLGQPRSHGEDAFIPA